MDSADDDVATRLAARMDIRNADPLTVTAWDPDPPIRSDPGYGEGFCGHHQQRFDLNVDRRTVVCRLCGTTLDPYWVLEQLAGMPKGQSVRLQAMQELEKRELVREGDRQARAAVRRHRYARYAYKREMEEAGGDAL